MASAYPICLMAHATSTKSWLWHQRLSNLNFDTINDLAKNDLVTGFPKFKYYKEYLCPSCEQGKSKNASHPPKLVPNLKQRLIFLYMDLCGPIRVESIHGKPPTASTTTADTALTPTNSSSQATNIPNTSQDVDELEPQQQHVQQQDNQAPLQPKIVADNVPNAMFDGDVFENPFAPTSIRLDLTFAPSTITTQKPTERELDLLFEAMYDDYIGGQPSATTRTVPDPYAPQVLQILTASTTTADTDVDELETRQQHVQQQDNQASLQPEIVADNVSNAMLDENLFVNPVATPSISAAESSSSQYVDPSNMHTFYQPYPHEYHTMEPSNVKEDMKDPAWIDSMLEELLQFKWLNVWVLVPAPDNINSVTLKWLFKNKHDEREHGH
ncbi:retrovirus-related pol polyprotein from transposon TNT 1-94 [Tanacetum coccineum]